MKKILILMLTFSPVAVAMIGCGDSSSTTKETTVSTPGGTTTVTEEVEVEKTGENPPPAQP